MSACLVIVGPSPRTTQMYTQMLVGWAVGAHLGPAPALGLPPGEIDHEQWGRAGRRAPGAEQDPQVSVEKQQPPCGGGGGGLTVGSMGWKPDLCMVLFWCSASLLSSFPSPLPAYPQTCGAELYPWHQLGRCARRPLWHPAHAGCLGAHAGVCLTPQEQSQVSLAGSHHHFSLSMVAGPASLSYAWHVCGHRGQLWRYLVLVVLVLCLVCLLLFLHNA